MASPQSRNLAIMCMTAIGVASAGMYMGGVKTRREDKSKSVHGTGTQSEKGMETVEPAMNSMDVRKAVQGREPDQKYPGQ